MSSISPVATAIARIQDNDPTLVEANLSGCDLSTENARALFVSLRGNAHLHTLNLSNCKLTLAHIAELPLSLGVNFSLRSVNFEGNAINSAGLAMILNSLKDNVGVTEIKLGNQKCISGTEAEMALVAALESNEHLLKAPFPVRDAIIRSKVDKLLSRNNDLGMILADELAFLSNHVL